jgi:hypothetical protein
MLRCYSSLSSVNAYRKVARRLVRPRKDVVEIRRTDCGLGNGDHKTAGRQSGSVGPFPDIKDDAVYRAADHIVECSPVAKVHAVRDRDELIDARVGVA